MVEPKWAMEFPGAITLCNTEGTILWMNEAAVEVFTQDGGLQLIGKNVLDCHPEPARSKLERMLENQTSNIYTIEENGRKKLIFQSPWYQDGNYAGLIELALEIPFDMPHLPREQTK